MTRLRVAFIGWGAINSRVGSLLRERSAPVDIVAVATSSQRTAPTFPNVIFLDDPERIAEIRPDLVVEAAGRAAVGIWAPMSLRHAKALVVASTSAFRDDDLLSDLCQIAGEHGSRILVPSGAIGGIDALAAAAVLPLELVLHQIVKPPQAWKNTNAENRIDLDNLRTRQIFFTGSAREAARYFPQNANATVVTSLAGIGLDRTCVELVADPDLQRNQHHISACGAFGSLRITLENEPSLANPKSSELTALSLVHLVERQLASLVI